jgi:transposase
MDSKRLDIVEVVERRRKWPAETIAQIMEEALAPGATVASVADRHGVARSQVYGWLRKARAGKLPGISVNSTACTGFVPVKVEEHAAPAPLPVPRPVPASRRRVPVKPPSLPPPRRAFCRRRWKQRSSKPRSRA